MIPVRFLSILEQPIERHISVVNLLTAELIFQSLPLHTKP